MDAAVPAHGGRGHRAAAGVFALPSALNLPQANPGQTLEYAPVPGDQGHAPPGGNLAGLGLGQGGTGEGTTGTASPPPTVAPLDLNGSGANPSTENCVGNPPRQTEDPMSPPCVAYFAGNNGGASYQGVSANEVRILAYVDGSTFAGTDEGTEPDCINGDAGQYFDLAGRIQSSDTYSRRNLKRLAAYFNARYQTYGRYIHFWELCSTQDSNQQNTPQTRRADAADNYARLHPFAVVTSQVFSGYEDDSTANGDQAGSGCWRLVQGGALPGGELAQRQHRLPQAERSMQCARRRQRRGVSDQPSSS